MDDEKKKQIALFRFGVISQLLGLKKTEKGERERLLREIAQAEWDIPESTRTTISRSTAYAWLKQYESGGGKLEALYPQERTDKGTTRSMATETQAAFIGLRHEFKKASLPTLLTIARERNIVVHGEDVSVVKLWRLFKRLGITMNDEYEKTDRRKFEAETVNDLWQADCMYGPYIAYNEKRRRTYLLAIIDDHSRFIVAAQFYFADKTENFLDCLEQAIVKRGVPRKLYVDNGPVFRSKRLTYITASIGIALIHAKPYVPQGKGKIERWFRTVRLQLMPLLKIDETLETLNEKLMRWIEDSYHIRVHSSTKETPCVRYVNHVHLLRSAPINLADHFRVCVRRKVRLDRTVSINGKLFESPVGLIDKTINLLFHPENAERIEVVCGKKSWGFLLPVDPAINYRVGRSEKVYDQNNEKKSAHCRAHDKNSNSKTPYCSGTLFNKKIGGSAHE